MSDAQQKPPGLWVALLFGGAGLAMMVFMAVDQTGLNVPLWVAEIAAATFVFAGASMASNALGWSRITPVFSLGAVWCLLVPGAWIALGPHTGSCTGGIGIGMITSWREAGNLECRIAFGAGALITLFCALAMTWAVLRGRKPSGGGS